MGFFLALVSFQSSQIRCILNSSHSKHKDTILPVAETPGHATRSSALCSVVVVSQDAFSTQKRKQVVFFFFWVEVGVLVVHGLAGQNGIDVVEALVVVPLVVHLGVAVQEVSLLRRLSSVGQGLGGQLVLFQEELSQFLSSFRPSRAAGTQRSATAAVAVPGPVLHVGRVVPGPW